MWHERIENDSILVECGQLFFSNQMYDMRFVHDDGEKLRNKRVQLQIVGRMRG